MGFGFDVWSMAVTILTIAMGEQYIWDFRNFQYRLDPMYYFLIIQGGLNNTEMLMELANALNNTNLAESRDRKSTRLNSSHVSQSRMPSSA